MRNYDYIKNIHLFRLTKYKLQNDFLLCVEFKFEKKKQKSRHKARGPLPRCSFSVTLTPSSLYAGPSTLCPLSWLMLLMLLLSPASSDGSTVTITGLFPCTVLSFTSV